MLIDTHCHLNMIVKEKDDILLTSHQINAAQSYIDSALHNKVTTIINVGTNIIESLNSIALAQRYASVYATIGLHPTDCTDTWQSDFKELKKLMINKQTHKIVAIGECGIDLYHQGYNLKRQQDAFKAQIELALEHDVALVIHSRDAAHETLSILDEYKNNITRATMHCFSYDQSIARDIIAMGLMLGIDGPITYKKNDELRAVATHIPLEHIVLETDAPFLPPQIIRGKQNEPKYIATIATFVAELRNTTLEDIASQTTANARNLFNLDNFLNLECF
ncbi:MAG: TatD family hydrolase [Candidatus Dependentiae bacterium]|nr:TatD family hydrolase [Candidatus Dependentiae bacterium]